MRVIENQLDGATVVMIAHRLSTVKFCNQIYYLEDGTVTDSGTFNQLNNSCDSFRQMVEAGDERV